MATLVSIIIVNYNGEKVLEDCLKSVEKITYPTIEIILVDNGSTDGSLDIIKKYKTVTLIKNSSNAGFAPANNQGAKVAKGEYILLLNNDTKVPANFLNPMIEKMELDSTIGAMQPKIFLMDQPDRLDNAGSFLNTIGFSNHWGFGEKDGKDFNSEREIFSAKGACLLTRAEVVKKIDLFDNDFVSYFEESDFCWRVWLGGWKVLYYPKSHIYHKLGYTSKNLPVLDVNFHSLKNRICSFIKNFNGVNVFRYTLTHIFFLLGLTSYYIIKLQFAKVAMIQKALWWNISHLSDTLGKRQKIQKIRMKPDREILSVIMQPTNFKHMMSHFQKVEANFSSK